MDCRIESRTEGLSDPVRFLWKEHAMGEKGERQNEANGALSLCGAILRVFSTGLRAGRLHSEIGHWQSEIVGVFRSMNRPLPNALIRRLTCRIL